MSALLDDVRREIEDMHALFVDWVGGTAAETALDDRFVTAMDEGLTFVSPEGREQNRDDLTAGLRAAYGANPAFRIAIRDVKILRKIGELMLVSYTEWQRGTSGARAENGRISTLLISRAAPFRWLHVHETWLPEDVQDAGDYSF